MYLTKVQVGERNRKRSTNQERSTSLIERKPVPKLEQNVKEFLRVS